MIGAVLGNYRVLKRLGMGGMGAVYLGEHTLIGRKAAIKVLLPEFSRKQEIVERFFNEARAGTAIGHPGIVQIFDFGFHKEDDSAFLVMELLQGEPLNERLDRLGRLGEDEALRIARQCASALAAAHNAGIIHRDLKPANIFLATDPEMEAGERVKVLDFGIAKLTDSGAAGDLRTRTGSMMGTPAYMSPEQCRGAGLVDHRSDIYSLGCVIFRMLCGRAPFVADGVGELIACHLREPAPTPRSFEPGISAALEAVVLRTLAKAPDARFSSMEELASVLQSMRQGSGVQGGSMYRRPATTDASRALAPVAFAPPPGTLSVPDLRPPVPAQRTAFQTNHPNIGTDVVTAPMPAAQPYPRTGTPEPTTLGSVASQRMQAVQPRSRRGIAIAGGATVVGIVLAVIVGLSGEGEPDTTMAAGMAAGEPPVLVLEEPARAAASAPDPGQPELPGDGPEPAASAPVASPAAEPVQASGVTGSAPAQPPAAGAPGPKLVSTRITSTPPGAKVHVSGQSKHIGETPFDFERPADAGPTTLTLKHSDHETEKIEIPAGSDEPIAVTLRRQGPAERKPPRPPAERAKPGRKNERKSNVGDTALETM